LALAEIHEYAILDRLPAGIAADYFGIIEEAPSCTAFFRVPSLQRPLVNLDFSLHPVL